MQAFLRRFRTGLDGTMGVFVYGEHLFCSLELPWKDNRRGISCIPKGTYPVKWVPDGRKGKEGLRVFHVQGVPGRTGILIHSGNFAGSEEDGYLTHVQGCILLGQYFGTLPDGKGGRQKAVLYSTPTIKRLRSLAEDEWTLTVEEDYNGG